MPNVRKTRVGNSKGSIRFSRVGGIVICSTVMCGFTGISDASPQSRFPTQSQNAVQSVAGVATYPGGTATVDAEANFRSSVGLRNDIGYINALHAKGAAGGVEVWNGMLFTKAEADELRTREAAAKDIDRAVFGYLRTQPADVYGGDYLDHRSGKVIVNVTNGGIEFDAALRKVTRYPDRLQVRTVKYTLSELNAAHTVIDKSRTTLEAEGVDINLARTNPATNRLEIGTDDKGIGRATELISRLVPAGMVAIMPGVQIDRVDCAPASTCATDSPPFKGGTDIESYDSQPGFTIIARWDSSAIWTTGRWEAAIIGRSRQGIAAAEAQEVHGYSRPLRSELWTPTHFTGIRTLTL